MTTDAVAPGVLPFDPEHPVAGVWAELVGQSDAVRVLRRAVVSAADSASIGKTQDSISFSKQKPVKLSIEGRHDPSIVVRAVPVIEAALAIVVLDYMEGNHDVK